MKELNYIALLPIGVFLVLYLGLGILFEYVMKIPMGFYNVPIVVAFLAAILTACLQNPKLHFDKKLEIMAQGVGDKNIITMLLIFLSAGSFVGIVGRSSAESVAYCMLSLIPARFSVAVFYRVDDVLPQDITAGTYRRQRVEVGIGYPDSKGGVLLAQRLPRLSGGTEVVTYKSAHGKLDDTEDKPQQRDDEQEGQRGVSVCDVLGRGARDDEQRATPHVVRQVVNAHYPPVQPLHAMLHDIRQQHGQHQHHAHLVQDGQKGGEKTHIGSLVYQRETYRDEQRRDEVGDRKSVV